MSAPVPAQAPPSRRAGFPRRALRVLRRLVVLAVLLAIVLRVIVWIALPPVLRSVARGQGVEVSWERLDLSFLSGEVALTGLRVADGGTGETVASLDEAHVDLDVLRLLQGRIAFASVDVAGVEIALERAPGGGVQVAGKPGLPLEEAIRAALRADLGPPAELASLRLHRIAVTIVEPGLGAGGSVRVEISGWGERIGVPGEEGTAEITLWSPEVLDVLRVNARARLDGDHPRARVDVALSGLRPSGAAGLLRAAGLEPLAREIALRVSLEISSDRLQGADADVDADARRVGAVVRDLVVVADAEEVLGLDEVRVEAPSVTARTARIGEVSLRGLRAAVERRPNGALRAVGFEIAPRAEAEAVGAPAPVPPKEGSSDPAPPPLLVDRVEIRDVALRVRDGAAGARPADLALAVEEIALANVLPEDPSGAATTVRAILRAPGLADEARIEGDVRWRAPEPSADLTVAVLGITLEKAAPYLRAAGLESAMRSGSLRARLSATASVRGPGAPRASLTVRDLELADGSEVLHVDSFSVTGASSGDLIVGAESVEIAGVRLAAALDAGGSLRVAGLRTAPRESGAQEPQDALPSASGLPALEVGRFWIADVDLRLTDERRDPPELWEVTDLELRADDVALPRSGPPEKPVRLELSAWIPRVARSVRARGTASVAREPLEARIALDADVAGATLEQLRPWLDAAGIEPLFVSGDCTVSVEVAVREDEDGVPRADLTVERLDWREGDRDLLTVEAVRVRGARLSPEAPAVASIEIVRPATAFVRDAEGGFAAAGFRRRPSPDAEAAESAPAASAPAAPSPAIVEIPALDVGHLSVEDATVRWRDALAREPVSLDLGADLRLRSFRLPKTEDPAQVDLRLRLPGAIDEARLAGELGLARGEATLRCVVEASGIRPGALDAYLPDRARVDVADGRARAVLEASVHGLDVGGTDARLAIRDAEIRDGAEGEALFRMGAFLLDVPRFDALGNEMVVEEISMTDLSVVARRLHDGSTSLLGLRIEAGPDEPEAAPVEEPAARRRRRRMPFRFATDAGLPTIVVRRFDVGVDRLDLTDETIGPAGRSLIGSLRISTPGPVDVLGPQPEDLAPIQLRFHGGADPVVGGLEGTVEARPFAAEPGARVALALSEVRGPALAEWLAPWIGEADGTALPAGRLEASLEARLRTRRRGPFDFDLSRGFGGEIALENVALRPVADGPVLAGFDALRVDVARVEPEAGRARIRAIELQRPVLHASWEADGLHALGFRLPAERFAPPAESAESKPAPETSPSAAEASSAPAESSAPSAPAPASRPERPPFEIAIDEVAVRGIDARFRDTTVTPALDVPIDDLSISVHDLSSRFLEAKAPVRFHATLDGGAVELARRRPKDASVLGILGSAARAVTGGDSNAPVLESRPLFGEVTIDGDLAAFPRLAGSVRVDVEGFELASLKGVAARSGTNLEDGLLDGGVRLQFGAGGALNVSSELVLTDLGISEPSGGPIASVLRLPAPLDAVMFVLEDEDGAIHVPLDFTVPADGVSIGGVTELALVTLGRLVTQALANTPFRVGGAALGLLGLSGGESVPVPPFVLFFDPGGVAISSTEKHRLQSVVEELLGDEKKIVVLEHLLSESDYGLCAGRANPTEAECRLLSEGLRARRSELGRRRAELSADLRASFAVGDLTRGEEVVERLRVIESELGEVEQSLDRVHELLRPGAERRTDDRTGDLCIDLARRRMEELRRFLRASGVPAVDRRIEVRRPRAEPFLDEGGGRVVVRVKTRRARS